MCKAVRRIDPHGRPKVTLFSQMSVRPTSTFQSLAKTKQILMFTTDETVVLSVWIIDDTCLVSFFFS